MTMRLDFTLDRQVITRIDSNRVVAGSKGYVTAHFTDVSGDWAEPVTAIFGAYAVLLEGMECAVPWEVLADPGAFEVSAFCGDLHTANTARVDVEATGYKKGETPGDPTPDVYAVLVEKARRAEEIAQSVRDDADAGHFDGEDGKTPVRGVDYWTPEDRKPIEDATLDATTAAGKADAAAENASVGEASRTAFEIERVANETARIEAESGRKSAEATRVANESERTETFNANLTSWNGKVDAACKKATDTASKAAQDAKIATGEAIAKTEEATNAAIAKVQTATDNATTAANKAEAAVAQLPVPSGNVLKGEAEATLVHVDDAYPAPLVTAKVMGQSNQQQEPAPSPENPQEITNLNKAELVVAGKNLADVNESNKVNFTLHKEPLPAGTYTFSCDNGKSSGFMFNVKRLDDSGIAKEEIVSSRTSPCTFTISEPTMLFINGWGLSAPYNIGSIQLEVGSKATAYEPTIKPKATPIDLQGNELCSLPNGVKDEVVIDAEGNVSLIKRTKQYNWNCVQIIKGTGRNYAVDKVLDIGANYTGLVAEKAINAVNNAIGICYVDQKMIYVTVPESVVTKEQANQLYGGMKVIYQLAEPQIIPLGKVELPALPEATSNVWNNGNIPANVHINYLKDVNIAFSKLESKLTQAVVATAANL